MTDQEVIALLRKSDFLSTRSSGLFDRRLELWIVTRPDTLPPEKVAADLCGVSFDGFTDTPVKLSFFGFQQQGVWFAAEVFTSPEAAHPHYLTMLEVHRGKLAAKLAKAEEEYKRARWELDWTVDKMVAIDRGLDQLKEKPTCPQPDQLKRAWTMLNQAEIVDAPNQLEGKCDQCDLQAVCWYLHGQDCSGCKAFPKIYKLKEEKPNG